MQVAQTFTVKDVEYRHLDGDKGLLARVYQPSGIGPFTTLVAVHGGAWVHHDRLYETDLHEALAARGILTVAIDFRGPARGELSRLRLRSKLRDPLAQDARAGVSERRKWVRWVSLAEPISQS
jgi:alpha-beta hydrolase superfamily lysophospholipase